MSKHLQRLGSLFAASLVALLAGCGHQVPKRPFVDLSTVVDRPSADCITTGHRPDALATPETGAKYVLHFVEFDDHGWNFPNDRPGPETTAVSARVNVNSQLDCAIEHLTSALRGEGKIALYVYVHGWHANAAAGDDDVEKFRRVLARYAKVTRDRQVIGIYVAWDGKTMEVPGLRHLLTFWPRKNAAHRIADGQVRELFGRLKALRAHHNRNGSHDCLPQANPVAEDPCKLRSVMIGHSFGGLILYSAVQPYLLETLTTGRDIPRAQLRPREPRSRGIADLVILLNPAFEASRYEPLFRAAHAYETENVEPPLLVSLTSMSDWAVGKGFPIARHLTTVFHYPANSALEAEALRDTIGNVGSYVTHSLCLVGGSCENEREPKAIDEQSICGMQLRRLPGRGTSPIWNVKTYGDIIAHHNDIMRDRTINFFEYAYALGGLRDLPCVTRSADPVSSLPAAEPLPKPQ